MGKRYILSIVLPLTLALVSSCSNKNVVEPPKIALASNIEEIEKVYTSTLPEQAISNLKNIESLFGALNYSSLETIQFKDKELVKATLIPFKTSTLSKQKGLIVFHDLGDAYTAKTYMITEIVQGDNNSSIKYYNKTYEFGFNVVNGQMTNRYEKYPNGKNARSDDTCNFGGCIKYNLDFLQNNWWAGLPCLWGLLCNCNCN